MSNSRSQIAQGSLVIKHQININFIWGVYVMKKKQNKIAGIGQSLTARVLLFF